VEVVEEDGGDRALNCTRTSSTYLEHYRKPGHWTPDYQITPPKTILVNFVVCRKNNGTNGWENSPFMLGELQNLMESVSTVYTAPGWRNYPSTCPGTPGFVSDSYIRFELNQVYFIDDTRFNEAYGQSSNDLTNKATSSEILDWLWANHPETKGALNHIFTSPAWDDYVSYQGFYSTHNGHSYVHSINLMLGSYPGYSDDWDLCKGHLAHEYGHGFGLHHTYPTYSSPPGCVLYPSPEVTIPVDHFNFLDDVFGTCPEPLMMDPNNSCMTGCTSPCSPAPGFVCHLTGPCFFNQYPAYYPLMSGVPPNTYISPKMAGRMHRTLGLFKNSWITSTQPMHQYVKEKHPWVNDYPITADETWDFPIKMYQNIVVEPGTALTITCEVYMPIGGKIIVKPNARLIIDGGLITCAHTGQFWHGIEVWGTTNQHQFPSSNPTHQGLLVLKNGAIIEHAREGSTNWKPGDWNSLGGVIQVQGTPNAPGALFLNNRRSAGFMAYQNFHPGNPGLVRTNNSYFNYAHFKVDDDYRGGNDFHDHVSMWKVDGIVFRACTLENAQNTVTQSSQLGRGIFSMDANYTVTGNCTALLPVGVPCPVANLDRGYIIGLDHGVDARDGGSGRGFTVQDCSFENNVVGVYTDGLSSFTVSRNNFTLGDRDVSLDGEVDENFQEYHHRGISTQRSHGFRIEENEFQRAGNTVADGVTAVVIENSRENNTQVYKNRAFNMNEGYIGEGRCMDFMQSSSIGHQFLCNENNGNEQNFWARKDDDGSLTWNHSIRTQQGSDPTPAGNRFDQDQGVPLESDYKNSTEWVINYWHGGGQGEPMDVTLGWLGKTLATGVNNCPSRLSGREVRMTQGLQEQVGAELQTAKAAYVSTAYVFNSMLDGGNTDAVVDEIQQSWPNEAWELRGYLLSKSPYLSTEALKEMMLKNILPQAMTLEICLANPEATKKEGFTRWAEYEAPNPLPNYMIDLIAGSWAPRTFRMQLEAQIGQHHANMTLAADILQDALRSDEEMVLAAEALSVWLELPNYGARFGELAERLRTNDFGGARALLNGMLTAYPMKEDRPTEISRAHWYVDQLEGLHGQGRQVLQLTEAEVAQWRVFAEAAGDMPGTWVANVLCYGYNVCIGRGGGAGGGNKALRPSVADATAVQNDQTLVLMPNPASTWVTLSYQLTEQPVNAHARIVDARGREVATLPITANKGQHVWDTRQVPAGVYTVELFTNNLRVTTERLVVQPNQ
jgi:hypothetical protein